jgi:hypothetical protein
MTVFLSVAQPGIGVHQKSESSGGRDVASLCFLFSDRLT